MSLPLLWNSTSASISCDSEDRLSSSQHGCSSSVLKWRLTRVPSLFFRGRNTSLRILVVFQAHLTVPLKPMLKRDTPPSRTWFSGEHSWVFSDVDISPPTSHQQIELLGKGHRPHPSATRSSARKIILQRACSSTRGTLLRPLCPDLVAAHHDLELVFVVTEQQSVVQITTLGRNILVLHASIPRTFLLPTPLHLEEDVLRDLLPQYQRLNPPLFDTS